MKKVPAVNALLIKLNPDWTVENSASVSLEQMVSIDDFSGNRLVITMPGAGGFCNKEIDLIKNNLVKFREAGANEVILVVGTDILTNADRGIPNILHDVDLKFAESNGLLWKGVKSRFLKRSAILIDSNGNEVARVDSKLLACRTPDHFLGFIQENLPVNESVAA